MHILQVELIFDKEKVKKKNDGNIMVPALSININYTEVKLLFGIAFLCLALGAKSQSSIQGIVKDESSNPVSEVKIHLLNTANNTVSDSNGTFSLTNLNAGTYSIYSTKPGYEDEYKTVILSEGTNVVQLQMIKSANYLETVIVTAQKREELVQRLPMSITAISSKEIEAYKLWNISDLTGVSSNLYSSNPGDNRNVTSIRGIVSTSYDQAVATYVDGVSQFNLDTYIPQLFDVERIEILKGPQGTLYGRNAMGGVINIITKKPQQTFKGFARVSVGNYGLQRFTAGVQAPLVKDKLFLGLAGLYEGTKGFYTNDFNGSDYDKRHSFVGNYYLRFEPGANWSLLLNAKNAVNRNNGAFPLVFGVDEAFAAPFHLNQNAITKMIDNVLNTSLSVHHYGKTVQFSSQTAYQSNYRYYVDPIDADFSPLDAMSIINNYGNKWNRTKVLTQEFNLKSPAQKSDKVGWITGAYLFHQNSPVKQATRFGDQAEWVGAPDKNSSLINTTTTKVTGASGYGEFVYTLVPKLKLTAGLRYDFENDKQQILGEYQKDPDPNPMFAYRTDTSASANFSAWSPRLALAWYPSDKQLFYISYGRGFRAGGLTPLSSDPSQPPMYPFKPEYSNNLEAGWKQSTVNQKLRFNLTVFYTTVNDAQVPTLVLPDAVTITRNTGRLTSKGAEAELHALPFRGFRVDYSFGYTDAQFSQLLVSENGHEVDFRGKHQLFTPDVTSMLAGQYQKGINNNLSVIMRAEWKFLGRQYFDLANTIMQSPYHLLNTSLELNYKNAGLKFWVRNITGKNYIAYAYDFGAVHLGDPRTIGMTLAITW